MTFKKFRIKLATILTCAMVLELVVPMNLMNFSNSTAVVKAEEASPSGVTGTGATGTGEEGAGSGTGATGTGEDGTGTGATGTGEDGTGTGATGTREDGTGTGATGTGEDGTGTGATGTGEEGTGNGATGSGEDGTGTGVTGTGEDGTGTGATGSGETGVAEASISDIPGGVIQKPRLLSKRSTPTPSEALIFYVGNASNIADSTTRDAGRMTELLEHVQGPAGQEIVTQEVQLDENEAADSKQLMLDTMEDAFSDNDDHSFSIVFYSGHGSYNEDGSACFAIGDDGELSATELRTALNKYKGTYMVISVSCFSGGMLFRVIRKVISKAVMDQSKVFSEKFTQDFSGAGSKARSGYDGNRYKLFMAAQATETAFGIETGSIGTMFTYVLEHALGYDEDHEEYNNYAADFDGNGYITCAELQSYLEKQYIISMPAIFPSHDNSNLFEYDGDPAFFDASLDDSIIYGTRTTKDGVSGISVDIPVKIKACNTDDSIKMGLKVYEVNNDSSGDILTQICVGDGGDDCGYDSTWDMDVDHDVDDPVVYQNYFVPDDMLDKEYGIKVGFDCSDGVPGPSQLLRFTVREEDNYDTTISKSDFKIISPYMPTGMPKGGVSNIGDLADYAIQKVYLTDGEDIPTSMKVSVRFDEEPTKKIGAAACKLTTTITQLTDGDGDQLGDGDDQCERTLYEDIRPEYVNEDRYIETQKDTVRSSQYTTMWDLKDDAGDICDPGYYEFSVTAQYDSGDSTTIKTYIYLGEQGEADSIITDWRPISFITMKDGMSLLDVIQTGYQPVLYQTDRAEELDQGICAFRLLLDDGTEEIIPQNEYSSTVLQTGQKYIVTLMTSVKEGKQVVFSPDCYVFPGNKVNDKEVESLYCLVDEKGKYVCWKIQVEIPESKVTPPTPPTDPPTPPTPPTDPPKPTPLPSTNGSDDSSDDYVRTVKSDDTRWSTAVAADGKTLWRYWIPNVGYAVNCWQYLGWNDVWGWYRFDENGYMMTGLFTDADGKVYYLNPVSNGRLGMLISGAYPNS